MWVSRRGRNAYCQPFSCRCANQPGGFRTGAEQTSAQEDTGLRLAFAWSAEGATPGLDPGHDLACSVQEHAGGLSVHFEHDTKALTAETATAWLGYYVQFLNVAAKGSE